MIPLVSPVYQLYHSAAAPAPSATALWQQHLAAALCPALASLLFDPPEPQDIEQTTVFRDFSTFSADIYHHIPSGHVLPEWI